jgi:hypothetical protein
MQVQIVSPASEMLGWSTPEFPCNPTRVRLLTYMVGDPVRFQELLELAKICAHQARVTTDPAVASELRRMAQEYRKRAAEHNNGELPDVGEI